MEILPSNASFFMSQDYWNHFYKDPKLSNFDWYGNSREILSVLKSQNKGKLHRNATIINVGCGNSTLSQELWHCGFKRIYNVDFSQVVLAEMSQKYSKLGMHWINADVSRPEYKQLLLKLQDENCGQNENGNGKTQDALSPLLIIDKAFLDSYISVASEDDVVCVRNRAKSYLCSTLQVLRPGDVFLLVTLGQKYILMELVRNLLLKKIHVDVYPMHEPDNLKSHGIHFIFYITVDANATPETKQVTLHSANEASTDFQLCKIPEALSLERMKIHLGPRIGKYNPGQRLTFDLTIPDATLANGGDKPDKKNALYFVAATYDALVRPDGYKVDTMAILIPSGYESLDTFSTNEGLEDLSRTAGFKRAIVIWLKHVDGKKRRNNPLDQFTNQVFAYVKQNMSNVLTHLALDTTASVTVATIDSASRVVDFKCNIPSKYAGSIMVRDVMSEDGKMSRQMLFGCAPQVVQSEVAYDLDVNEKVVFKYDNICNEYHYAIVLAMAQLPDKGRKVAILGGGAGILTHTLNTLLGISDIDVVELDEAVVKVARDYFSMGANVSECKLNPSSPNGGLDVTKSGIVHVVGDACDYIHSILHGSVGAIIVDINNYSGTGEFSPDVLRCPDAKYFEPLFLDKILELLRASTGVLVVNILTRSNEVRTKILDALAAKFPSVVYICVDEDVNIVAICLVDTCKDEILTRHDKQVALLGAQHFAKCGAAWSLEFHDTRPFNK